MQVGNYQTHWPLSLQRARLKTILQELDLVLQLLGFVLQLLNLLSIPLDQPLQLFDLCPELPNLLIVGIALLAQLVVKVLPMLAQLVVKVLSMSLQPLLAMLMFASRCGFSPWGSGTKPDSGVPH